MVAGAALSLLNPSPIAALSYGWEPLKERQSSK